MEDNKIDITSRAVMVEKKPFYVVLWNYSRENYDSEEVLVRPCVSEDDLSKARFQYENMTLQHNLSYNPMDYYLIIKGANFIGSIVERDVCKRINKK